MMSSSFCDGVAEVLCVLREHSEKYKSSKQRATKRERIAGWVALTGGAIFVVGEWVRQAGGPQLVYLLIWIVGLAAFAVGVAVALAESLRTTRRPFVEHVGRIVAALPGECELIATLERFEIPLLELVRERLKLESAKVVSRLGIIGGGEGLRTSLVGVAMLSATMVSQYEPVIHGWTMKSAAFFGVALLLGLSIGGLFARYGVSQADYYGEMIGLAVQRKLHAVSKPRERFPRRAEVRRRSGVGFRS